MSWFQKGDEGLKKKKMLDKQNELRKEKVAQRFWLKPGEKARIVFVDDDAFFCHMHQLNIGGSWNNYVTCTADWKRCPVCEDGHRATYTAHYTILDLRKYEKKDGTKVNYSKKLLPAKSSAIMRLHDLKKKYGSLKGLCFEVTRYENDPNCGGSFDYIGKVNGYTTKFNKEDRTPYDYEKVLAPPTKEELIALGFSIFDDEDMEEAVLGADDHLDDIDIDNEDSVDNSVDIDEVLEEDDDEEELELD